MSYEPRDADISQVVKFVVFLFGMIVLSALAAGYAWRLFSRSAQANATAVVFRATPLPPEPRLEVDPLRNLTSLRAKEEGLLQHYAWVDEQKGIVRIPIERAMELVAQRSLPARKAKP